MFIGFDKFDMPEKPVLTLAFPGGKEIGQLGAYEELVYEPALNSYSTLSFKYPYYFEDGEVSNLYDDVKAHMLIKAGGLGEFIIRDCEQVNDGVVKYLEITADGAESELCRRKVGITKGTYQFYDRTGTSTSPGLLNSIIKTIPSWSIGYVSADLDSKFRTFDENDSSTLYDFLMNEVGKTYGCLFVFDTINRTINAYTPTDGGLIKNSDIYIGYDGLLASENFKENSDNISTVMSCYGGDGVNIASANPMGTTYLYNFTHFKPMMSDGLRRDIERWERLYAEKAPQYREIVEDIYDLNVQIVAAQGELSELNKELKIYEDTQATKIAANEASGDEWNALIININNKNTEITNKENEIKALEADREILFAQQKEINDSLTIVSKLSDLSGTKWKMQQAFREDFVYISEATFNKNINYVSNGKLFNLLNVDVGHEMRTGTGWSWAYFKYKNDNEEIINISRNPAPEFLVGEKWLSDLSYQAIEIIGGVDAKDPELINWLYASCDRVDSGAKGFEIPAEEYLELEHFKFESTHQDDRFIVTDKMGIDERLDVEKQLYDECVNLMNQVSAPTYDITADAVNFLFIKELEPYINTVYNSGKDETIKQLIGTKFNLEVADGEWIEAVLLKMHINFDDPTDFSLEFSNKYRLNDALWTYADLIGETVSSNGSISFDYSALKTWETDRNDLLDFANGALDATRNMLVNKSTGTTMAFEATGLRGKSADDANGRQIWLTEDTLAFTDDNWQTVKTAVGIIPDISGGGYTYGVNAETLIGKAILGNNLTIQNNDNSFTMNGDGLTVENSKNIINLDPNNGILIKKKTTSEDIFKVDSNGDLIIKGNITATSGNIGGFTVTNNEIKSSNGNISLKSDGTGKIGMITIGTSSTTFDGNIYAKNILYGDTYGTLSGSAITASSITGSKIKGGAIDTAQIAYGAVTTDEIDMDDLTGYFDDLYAEKGTITSLTSRVATIENAYVDTATVNTLIGNKVTSTYVNGLFTTTKALSVSLAVIDTLELTKIDVGGGAKSVGTYTTGSRTYLVVS